MPPQHTDTTNTADTSEPITGQLTDIARNILDFERLRWIHPGAKESAIWERFNVTLTRYHQLLNQLIDHPAAEAYDPQTVRRLQRLRAARAQQRSALRAHVGR